MRLLTFLFLSAIAVQGFAGTDGHGGFGINCNKPITANNGTQLPGGLYALDYWDTIHTLKYPWGLGSSNLNWQEKIKIAGNRLKGLNKNLSQGVLALAEDPLKYVELSDEKIYCGNSKIIGEEVFQDIDIGGTVIPGSCKLEPIAKNISECKSDLVQLKKKIFINPNQFTKLNQDSKAAIVLHEYFYSQIAKKDNSERVRLLVALLARADFETMPAEEVRQMYAKTYTFPIDISIQGLAFSISGHRYGEEIKLDRPDGSLKSVIAYDGVQALQKNLNLFDKKLIVIPKTGGLVFYGYHGWRIDTKGNFRDYQILSKVLNSTVYENLQINTDLYHASLTFSEDGVLSKTEAKIDSIQSKEENIIFEKSRVENVSTTGLNDLSCIEGDFDIVKTKSKNLHKAKKLCFSSSGKIKSASLFEYISTIEFSENRKFSVSEMVALDGDKFLLTSKAHSELFETLKSIGLVDSSLNSPYHDEKVEMKVNSLGRLECLSHGRAHYYRNSDKRFYDIEIKLKDGKVKRFNSRVVIRFDENEQAISAVKGSGCL
ncbi:MAG: hypothetical protein V4596_12450 [Bdellovibrionota bacterium]